MQHSALRLATRLFGSGLVVAAAAFGCATSSGNADPSGPGASGSVTTAVFHRDVAPILQRHCQGCHVAGGIAPFPLVTYADAQPLASAIVDATHARLMPPWGAGDTPDCTVTRPWKDDLRLRDDELATLKAWQGAGAPEGDPKDAPPPLSPPARELADAQLKLRSEVGFAMSGTVDRLRCFVLDPGFQAPTFVTGVQIVPERPEVVHHALVFVDPTGESLAKADATGQYDCFGGPELSNPAMLAAWAPGTNPQILPPDVGVPIDAGSRLVMQVHYHAAPGVAPPADHTTVQIRTTATQPKYFAAAQLIGNFPVSFPGGGLVSGPDDSSSTPEFTIPPNVAGHTETMKLVIPPSYRGKPLSGLRLLAVGGHMHYVGVAEDVHLTRKSPPAGTPASECLLGIPRWDFDWQRAYTYDAPFEALPTIEPGDELSIRCTYDNTMNNPKMARALRESGASAPQTVKLGESTLDEMCLGAFLFVQPAP